MEYHQITSFTPHDIATSRRLPLFDYQRCTPSIPFFALKNRRFTPPSPVFAVVFAAPPPPATPPLCFFAPFHAAFSADFLFSKTPRFSLPYFSFHDELAFIVSARQAEVFICFVA